MSLRLLVDECTGTKVAAWLRGEGHEVFSIYDEARGMIDDWIIAKAHVENWIEANTTGSVGQKRVPASFLNEVYLPLPPLDEQRRIVAKLDELFSKLATIGQRLDKVQRLIGELKVNTFLAKLKQAILARAFRGELVMPEAELARLEGRDYEPASVLLERIRQEGAGREAPRRKSPAKSNTTKRAHAAKLF